jgi:hypothetical protein
MPQTKSPYHRHRTIPHPPSRGHSPGKYPIVAADTAKERRIVIISCKRLPSKILRQQLTLSTYLVTLQFVQ